MLLDGRTPHGVRGLKCARKSIPRLCAWSHPSRGAWIEISIILADILVKACRTPHGVRGLKSSRAAMEDSVSRRTPHGVRGLKSVVNNGGALAMGRTPHGVRGLKFAPFALVSLGDASHPSRGAWIEITTRHRA